MWLLGLKFVNVYVYSKRVKDMLIVYVFFKAS